MTRDLEPSISKCYITLIYYSARTNYNVSVPHNFLYIYLRLHNILTYDWAFSKRSRELFKESNWKTFRIFRPHLQNKQTEQPLICNLCSYMYRNRGKISLELKKPLFRDHTALIRYIEASFRLGTGFIHYKIFFQLWNVNKRSKFASTV